MKKLLPILFASVIVVNVQSQTFEYLDINNIKARVNTCRDALFTDGAFNIPSFEAPKGSGIKSIYAANLWIGGMDQNSNLHLAAETYSGGADFIPGPIMDSLQYASQTSQWNRVWKIERTDIDYHIMNYSQSGYIVPQVFLDWPAHGNTSLGQAANLAPFIDYNLNGIYDPANGDYPQVPGDQCVYYIFNDDTIHTETGSTKMKIEIHAFVYAFNCSADSALNHTIFLKYKIINRSQNTYSNTSIGQWTDIDLGGAIDDYIASDLQRGSYYGYNGDNYDGNYQGSLGYDSLLASQAVVFLAGPYVDNDGFDNPITANIQNAIDSSGIPYPGLGLNYSDGIVDNERLGMTGFVYYNNAGQGGNPAQTDPNNPVEYFNFLNGIWLDSTNMVYGGNGHISSGNTIECNYMFPGDSDPLNWGTGGIAVTDWSETSSGNLPSDRRGLGITGGFTFPPNAIHETDFAFVFARSYNSQINPIPIMNTRIDSVRNYFVNNQTPCGGSFFTPLKVSSFKKENISFIIYPNPASNSFILSYDGDETGLIFSVHDILGKEITSGKINSSQTEIDCSDWSKGVYLVKVGNESGYKVEKMVVE